MGQVPYEHIEATSVVRIDGVRAFNPGDPIPVDTARRLGLITEDTPVLPAVGVASSPQFTDAELKVAAEQAAAAGNVADAPSGAGTTPTPPQAPVKTPPKGSSAAPTTPES